MKWSDKLQIFRNRMEKIGINVQLDANYPWIYLYSVNGNVVKKEDYFQGNHGFTIMFTPITYLTQDDSKDFTDIKKIFEIIRKYR